jgi:hypothetical protein
MLPDMIRRTRLALTAALILSCGFAAAPAAAQADPGLASKPFLVAAADDTTGSLRHHAKAKAKAKAAKKAAKTKAGKKGKKAKASADGSAKPMQVGSFGDWGAFVAENGDDKTCYVLAQPKTRDPAKLKRDPGYVFISNRPGEHIHNEISITMGFPMKDGGDAEADVAGTSFDLVSKGRNAWIKNPAEEGHFVAALRHNAKLVIKAASVRGKLTTDTYSLAGIRQALDKAAHECR